MGFNSAFKGLKLLKKTPVTGFKQFKWPRSQCVNSSKQSERIWRCDHNWPQHWQHYRSIAVLL